MGNSDDNNLECFVERQPSQLFGTIAESRNNKNKIFHIESTQFPFAALKNY